MKNILLLLAFATLIFSCTNESESRKAYNAAVTAFSKSPSKESASKFVSDLASVLKSTSDKAERGEYLQKGLDVAEEYKMGAAAIGYLMPLVKNYNDSDKAEDHQAKLASVLSDVGKKIPSDILIHSYLDKYPQGKYRDQLLSKQKEKIDNVDTFIVRMATQIFENPDKFGINRLSAQKYVDACEAYALGYSDNKMAPEYLYRAAEMARTLKTYPKALSLYDWIENNYPNYDKLPVTMFLKGFMLENELNDKKSAKKVYQEFTAKFPGHDLQDDVKFLLDNIDKSDEEIMKIIEKK